MAAFQPGPRLLSAGVTLLGEWEHVKSRQDDGMGTVTAELKYLRAHGDGAAIDGSLEGFSPPEPKDFGFNAVIYIGVEGEEGMDLFDLVVCSPPWMARELTTGRWMARITREDVDPITMTPFVFYMQRWEPTELLTQLRSLCARCSPAPDWSSLANRLARYMAWEYDYKYDEYVDAHPDQFRLPKGWAGRSWK